MTALIWKVKQDIHMLMNTHNPPAEDNFCDKHENAIKLVTVEDYNKNMGFVNKVDRITNSYSISNHLEVDEELDLTIPNSFVLLSFCGAKLTHQDFTLTLV
jgi:hypothetical protein